MQNPDAAKALADILIHRFGGDRFAPVEMNPSTAETLGRMAGRGSCREFTNDEVPRETVRMLCAIALSSPTKSDLQQRDIILVTDAHQRALLAGCVADQAWIGSAPHLAIFCGNNRRQRQLHERSGIEFANDHLDAFFNAAIDAGVALSAFVTAAEAMELGCCPISGIRNQIDDVAELLGLPDHVFPVAGLAFGHPAAPPRISCRLPLATTLHDNRFSEAGWPGVVTAYDARRHGDYKRQRYVEAFGMRADYSWSEDKLRQYSRPERETFGAFVRRIGFKLD